MWSQNLYVYGGALLFAQWENWSKLDGAYFCFISLSTIGFGDYVPNDVQKKGIEPSLTMIAGEVRDFQYPVGSTGSFCSQNQRVSSTKVSNNNSCCGSIASILSSIGVCLLVLGYTLIGALTFMALEGRSGPQSDLKVTEHDHLRSQTVEKLWSITEDLNILYKDNWTRLAEQEVLKFQNSLIRKYKHMGNVSKNYNWSFPSAFLYSLTLITTIGYGNITPKTAWGRLATIAYALIGIPLMLVYLSTVGDTLAKYFRLLYSKITRVRKPQMKNNGNNKKDPTFLGTKTSLQNQISEKQHCTLPCAVSERPRVPIYLTLCLVIGYISGGAFLFNRLENWSFIEGSYFCFTSLGTIGFGELVPGTKETGNDVSVFVSSAFILVGMAVVAMCFNLVQDETVLVVQKMNLWWHKGDKTEDEDVSLSIKSS